MFPAEIGFITLKVVNSLQFLFSECTLVTGTCEKNGEHILLFVDDTAITVVGKDFTETHTTEHRE